MLTKSIRFELEYYPEDKELMLIDYTPPNNVKPVKLIYKGIDDIEKLNVALNAWIEVKETTKR